MLTARQWKIDGNWYAPSAFLQKYKSVYAVEFIDQTSSAGDWSGLIFQRVGNAFVVIPFCQENNYPGGGFTLTTNEEPWISYPLAHYDQQMKRNIIDRYCEEIGKLYYPAC